MSILRRSLAAIAAAALRTNLEGSMVAPVTVFWNVTKK